MNRFDLQKNIDSKSREELTELLRSIRQNRRTYKQASEKTVERKAVKAIKTASKETIFNAIDKMSEEQKKALLEDLLKR